MPAKVCAPVVTTPRAATPASGTLSANELPSDAGLPATDKSAPGTPVKVNPIELGVTLLILIYAGTQWAPSHMRIIPGCAPVDMSCVALMSTEGVGGKL